MDNPPVIDALRRLAGGRADTTSDAELLARFVESRDAGAFEALVQRHGRLVWGACRRRLRSSHSAEDAFQATFLALARHASTVHKPDALAAWLHRVAVRCTAEFRPQRYHMSTSSLELPARSADPATVAASRDLEQLIDSEIDALPEPFRLAFVMCEVQQRTAADVATTLGCAIGTIESRLTRARKWLRARLTRRGVSVGSVAGGTLATEAVPASARAGAVAIATGSSPLPTGLAALADRAVRLGMKSLTLGVGMATAASLVGLGGLIWILSLTDVPFRPFNSASVPGDSAELAIPGQPRFQRCRDNLPLPPEAMARVGSAWLRHGAIPQRMAFSDDGHYLATGGTGDHWLRVWDLRTTRSYAQFWLEDGEFPAALALDSKGDKLRALVGTGDAHTAQLREYDTSNGLERRRRLLTNGPFTFAIFDHDARQLAVSTGGLVRMFDAGKGKETWRTEVAAANGRVELSFAAKRKGLVTVATGSDRARILDADTGRVQCEIVEPDAALTLPTISADGQRLAVLCANSQRIRVWDLAKRERIKTITPRCTLSGICMAPDGKTMAVISKIPLLISIDSDEEPRPLLGVFGGAFGRFSPDAATLAVASRAMAVQLLDVGSAKTAPSSPREVLTPWPVSFADDGQRLLVEGFQSWVDYSLSGAIAPRALDPGYGEHEKMLFSAGDRSAVSPDRSLLARCTAGKNANEFTIDLIDGHTGKSRGQIELDQAAWHPAFSADGKIVFAITADRYVRGWNVETCGEVVRTAVPLANAVSACTSQLLVSPDSRYLAAAQMPVSREWHADTIRIFDARSGEQKFCGDAAPGSPRMAFSPDSKSFAAVTAPHNPAAALSELSIWDTTTGKLKVTLPAVDGQPAFSPDARSVAVTHDHGVLLIELATGRTRHEFRHFGKVEPALAWRGDGRVLASASPEAPVYLWDVVGDRTSVPARWDPSQGDHYWANLSGLDASAAFCSIRQMAAHPTEAVEFLRGRIVPDLDARVAARVCEALELIATPAARKLLRRWATVEKETCPLSYEASSSLGRLHST